MRELFHKIDWMMELPKPLEIEFREELTRFEKEKIMPYVTSIERLGREEGRSQDAERRHSEEGHKPRPKPRP